VEVALGPLCGLLAGVLLFLTGLSAGAAVAVLFARSLTSLAAGAPAWLPATLIVVVIAALAAVNVRGVRRGARFVELVTLAKLVPLIAFVVVGAAFVDPTHFTWHGTPALSSVLGTAGVVIFAFSGIESALTPSGEVHEPERTVPRASFLALGAATVLYLAIQWVALGIKGIGLAANETTPLADAAAAFAGPAGRIIIILGASVSMLGYLSGNVLAVPRSLFALARDGFLPRWLSSVHAHHRTPHVAIVLYALAIGALALTGTFEHLAIFANLTACVLYILCAIGVWVLRRRDVRTAGAPFLMPGGPLIPIATCIVNAWLIYETIGPADVKGLALAAAAAFILYLGRAGRRAQPHLP
jgi:amino acid transporter